MLKFSLAGHEFVLRDLGRSDVKKYLVFFNALSEESVRCRFGHLLAKLSEAAAQQRTQENTEDEKAVAIFDAAQERIVAIGRCYLDGNAKEAEIALVVAEDQRRLGLGRWLLGQLINIARQANSRSISAFIATQNAPVVRLLLSARFVVQPSNQGEDLELTLRLLPQDGDEASGLPVLRKADPGQRQTGDHAGSESSGTCPLDSAANTPKS